MPQTRTRRVRRESPPGFKCQTRSTRGKSIRRIIGQSVEHPNGLAIQIAERLGLKAIGHDAKEKPSGEVGRREPAPMVPPAKAHVVERKSLQLGEFRFETRADR